MACVDRITTHNGTEVCITTPNSHIAVIVAGGLFVFMETQDFIRQLSEQNDGMMRCSHLLCMGIGTLVLLNTKWLHVLGLGGLAHTLDGLPAGFGL